jgi:hypothetical protein
MTVEMILHVFGLWKDGKSHPDDPLHLSIKRLFDEAGTRGLTAPELVEALLGRKLTPDEEVLVTQQTDGWQTEPGSPLEAVKLSTSTVPTADEIEAVISNVIQVEDGLCDGPSFDDLWWSEAIDPQGKSQAYGLGMTPDDARAHAWISVWWKGHNSCEALLVVPRVVPEGWQFEIYLPGGPTFRRASGDRWAGYRFTTGCPKADAISARHSFIRSIPARAPCRLPPAKLGQGNHNSRVACPSRSVEVGPRACGRRSGIWL